MPRLEKQGRWLFINFSLDMRSQLASTAKHMEFKSRIQRTSTLVNRVNQALVCQRLTECALLRFCFLNQRAFTVIFAQSRCLMRGHGDEVIRCFRYLLIRKCSSDKEQSKARKRVLILRRTPT